MPDRVPPNPRRQQFSLPFGQEGDPVEGVFSVDLITYSNADNGFAVLRLVRAGDHTKTPVVAVGHFGETRVGECYRIEGVWHRDARYGMQIRVSSAMRETPRTLDAIERYLAGSSIKGLGSHYAKVLVRHFGERTFEELENGGRHLEQVSGIGPVRAQTIRESWAEHQGIHDLMVNLQGVAELTPNQAQRVFRAYGLQAWEIISRNPYRLADDVRGFGFRTCDRIGQALGIAHDAPQRIQAGVVYLLTQALDEGHLWSGQEELAGQAAELLGLKAEAVLPEIETLVAQERLIRETVEAEGEQIPALVLPDVARVEERIAERLATLIRTPSTSRLGLSAAEARALVARSAQSQLTEEQQGAVQAALEGNRIVILTGGPGTGKTTTVRSLLACLEQLHVPYALCATTGRASKQLSASTERLAATVHRHLGIGKEGVEPLKEAVLIIDEASMIDLWLLDQITARLTAKTHLFVVGDIDQLPSVGPGAVLQDLIAAGEEAQLPSMHVTRLSRIFRQEAGNRSMVVVNCHRIRNGQRPSTDLPDDSDYYEMYRQTPTEARELAVSLATERLPQFLRIPPAEVQVLAPMHRGEAGIAMLNQALQQALNPPASSKPELPLLQNGRGSGERLALRLGDKVRQTRNDYQKGVYNGDIGTVTRIDTENKHVVVQFDDAVASYTADDLDDLVHSWAMTVHSAQGSQWPAVIIIMLTAHYVMLERNILYTALSRAQRMAVLITQDRAVRIAVGQDRSTQRRTQLVARLQAAAVT